MGWLKKINKLSINFCSDNTIKISVKTKTLTTFEDNCPKDRNQELK
jgi:hypothetical protein